MMSLRPVAATANILAIATRNTDFNYPLLLRRFLKVLINKTTLLLLSFLKLAVHGEQSHTLESVML